MVTPPSRDREAIDAILGDRLDAAKTARRAAAASLEVARNAEDTWQRMRDAVRAGHHAAIMHLFRREASLFSSLRSHSDPSVPFLEELYRSSEQAAREGARHFPSSFPSACAAQNIQIDTTSRHPRYTVKEFIEITVDDRALEATIVPRDGQSLTLPLDVDPIVERLRSETHRLFEEMRDTKRLLAGLRKAYRAVLREEKKKAGEELPLRRVANRLSKNWAHFKYDEFNIDLARIVREGTTTVDKDRLHLNHTRDTRQGILLHGLERSGYFGFISFKPGDTNA